MNALGWLVLGLLAGWVIEFAIDFLYWRRKAQRDAEALAQKEAAIMAQQTELGHRQATMRMREREMSDLQASLASRDAELLQQARRVEERSDDLSRLEQQTEKRRADLDRMGLTLNEREKEIAARGDQMRSRESDYKRRLDTLESTEQELARRVAVVGNREEAMQSWEGRILSREHDVADREASVNYHAGRIASDAAAFDAVKHLLGRHYRRDGQDNLQALVGIDAGTESLLREAGIDGFQRLAETPLGELTRILQAAGPRFALVNPLSWAEQASYLLDNDYVALDRLQSELQGIRRDSVGDALLAAMLKKPEPRPAAGGAEGQTASDVTADSAAEGREAGGGATAADAVPRADDVEGQEPVGECATTQADAGVAAATVIAAGASVTAAPSSASPGGQDAVTDAESIQAATDAVSTGRAPDEEPDGERVTASSAADSADVAGEDGIGAESATGEPMPPLDEAGDAPQAVWASDAGDEGEGSGVYATAAVANAGVGTDTSPDSTTGTGTGTGTGIGVERVEAVPVDDDGRAHWPGAGGEVSDAVVLGEHARADGAPSPAEARDRVAGH